MTDHNPYDEDALVRDESNKQRTTIKTLTADMKAMREYADILYPGIWVTFDKVKKHFDSLIETEDGKETTDTT